MAAPIKHTCPDINAAQEELRRADSDLDDILGEVGCDEVDEEVRSLVQSARRRIENVCTEDLEKLRDSNDKLRQWGHELEQEVEELEEGLGCAEQECEALTAERDSLREELQKERARADALAARWAQLWALPMPPAAQAQLQAAGLGPPGEQLTLPPPAPVEQAA